jgi:hypothetical protein
LWINEILGDQNMTLIELLRFLAVLLCGALLGAGIAGAVGLFRGTLNGDFMARGGLVGGAATFIGSFALAWWFNRVDSIHPPCRCGKSDRKDFELGRAEGFRNVWQCTCGKRFSNPKWGLWFEIYDDGTVRLFMKRDRLGRWREPTEKEIANQSVDVTRACARVPHP